MTQSSRLAAFRAANNDENDKIISFQRAQNALVDFAGSEGDRRERAASVVREYFEERGAFQATAPKRAETPAPTTSAVCLSLAEARGTTAERKRFSDVFASAHSRGRERVCAELLTGSKTWSSKEIIAQLPHLPTDEERSSRAANARRPETVKRILDAQRSASGAASQSGAVKPAPSAPSQAPGSTLSPKAQKILAAQRGL